MNDNTETSEAYQERMTGLARNVSNVLDGINLEESAVICARITGFALGQIPNPQRDKIIDIVMNTIKQGMIDGKKAFDTALIELKFETEKND